MQQIKYKESMKDFAYLAYIPNHAIFDILPMSNQWKFTVGSNDKYLDIKSRQK